MPEESTLETRTGLPDALRVLLDQHPRPLWESHAGFDGLTRFWLERHMLFRELLDRIQGDTRAILDGRADPDRAIRATGRHAQLLLSGLHGHHQVEDSHYFPRLAALEPRLAAGFDLLDRDHQALDGHLGNLADATNRLIRAEPIRRQDRAGALERRLGGFEAFLHRHLTDEEDLVVPILLCHAEAFDSV